jgi:hypothetical protein
LVLDLHQSGRQRDRHEAGHKSVAIIQRYITANDDVKRRFFSVVRLVITTLRQQSATDKQVLITKCKGCIRNRTHHTMRHVLRLKGTAANAEEMQAAA